MKLRTVFRSALCALLSAVLLTAAVSCGAQETPTAPTESAGTESAVTEPEKIDNSALLPPILPDSQVQLETTGRLSTPDWFKSVIMVELRIETATPEGTFAAAIPLLDHYAEMGVNCLWLTPIYEKGPGGNGYGNIGLHTVDPRLTGTDDYEEGWQIVKSFVDEAHARNIRILLDVVTWGAMKGAPLCTEHPEFFSGEAWGNAAFNWKNEEFRAWFTEHAVNNILRTGADGYRCDCEPHYAGYAVFSEIRKRLLDAGRKVVIIAEDGNARKDAFDTETVSVLDYERCSLGELYEDPVNFYLEDLNIVDSVKTGQGIGMDVLQDVNKGGQYRFYTYCVTNHDYQWRVVEGNRLVIGYQALYAPFIPYWYMGDESGVTMFSRAVLYDVPVNAAAVKKTRFYEDVKQMIRIRRTYADIFEYFPDDHRDSNICAVKTTGLTALQAYARYRGTHAVLIIPNNEKDADGTFTAEIPYTAMGMPAGTYTVTDLLTGRVIAEGTDRELTSFSGTAAYETMGVYLIEKTG